jgi:UDP-glucose 6-dehydrogenase
MEEKIEKCKKLCKQWEKLGRECQKLMDEVSDSNSEDQTRIVEKIKEITEQMVGIDRMLDAIGQTLH